MIWPYIALSYLSLFVYGLCDNVRGPLYPEILTHFSLSNETGSLFFATSSFFAFISSLSSKHIHRYLDRIQSLYVALLIMSAALFLMGFFSNFIFFIGAASLFGIGMGILGVSQNILVTLGSSIQRRKQYLSGLHCMYGFASLLAPLLVTWLYGASKHWQSSIYFCAVLCFLLPCIGFVFFRKEFPNQNHHSEVLTPLNFRLRGGKLYFGLVMALYVLAEILISSRLALYMRRVKDSGINEANILVSIFFVFLLLGRIVMATWNNSISLRKQLIASLCFTAIFLVLGLHVNEWFLALSGLSMAPFFPIGLTYISEVFPKTVSSAIAYTTAVQSIFLVLMHLGFGYVSDQMGIFWAMHLSIVFVLASLLLLVFSSKVRFT